MQKVTKLGQQVPLQITLLKPKRVLQKLSIPFTSQLCTRPAQYPAGSELALSCRHPHFILSWAWASAASPPQLFSARQGFSPLGTMSQTMSCPLPACSKSLLHPLSLLFLSFCSSPFALVYVLSLGAQESFNRRQKKKNTHTHKLSHQTSESIISVQCLHFLNTYLFTPSSLAIWLSSCFDYVPTPRS